jgi:hypothetical protein
MFREHNPLLLTGRLRRQQKLLSTAIWQACEIEDVPSRGLGLGGRPADWDLEASSNTSALIRLTKLDHICIDPIPQARPHPHRSDSRRQAAPADHPQELLDALADDPADHPQELLELDHIRIDPTHTRSARRVGG